MAKIKMGPVTDFDEPHGREAMLDPLANAAE